MFLGEKNPKLPLIEGISFCIPKNLKRFI